jgi:iron complex transport system substrate-binding protein
VRGGRVFVVDANAYFTRPGPRTIDSLEFLAQMIHPDRFGAVGPAAPVRRWTASIPEGEAST